MKKYRIKNKEVLNDPEKLILWEELLKLIAVMAVSGIFTLLFG